MSSEPRSPEAIPLAPAWHTALLVALICAVAGTGTLLSSHASSHGGPTLPPPDARTRIVGLYLPLIVVQWGLVLYVARVGRPESALGSLLGRRWDTARRAAADLVLAALGWLAIRALELAWTRALGASASASVVAILPRSGIELAVWAAVSLSAGFCEEVVYRGYLQAQLGAFTRSVVGGILLQAILFGIAHADQGARGAVRVVLYGVAFGGLAHWRRSLLPGIACHVMTDFASGLRS